MRFASLGSGSQGNALVVEAGKTKIVLDAGFSTRSLIERLGRLAISPEEIDAILVTHEHSDHISGAFRFASRFKIPVYLTHGTLLAYGARAPQYPDCALIDSHSPFTLKDLLITPFPIPHDAREPVQYLFSDGVHRLGVLTDTGSITPHIVEILKACDALVLECNHDPEHLAASAYPASIKRRIAGNYGHLSNAQAAAFLHLIETKKLQHIVAAHLSAQNNLPELAIQTLATALGCTEDWIGIADQQQGFNWRELA